MSRAPAYMTRRTKYKETLDDFPTPPWVTRVFVEDVMGNSMKRDATVREPACGRGHMLRTLQTYSKLVSGSDIKDYGINAVSDYLTTPMEPVDYVITNPPFALAEPFFHKMYSEANVGVGLFVKLIWCQNPGRWARIFKPFPPTSISVLSQRMPGAQGKVVQHGSPFLVHAWFWWDKTCNPKYTEFRWLPPNVQSIYEIPQDYT